MLPVLVSVATQTDGSVESAYFELSVSSESSVSLSVSTLDLSSDESNDFLARRRVMSSQTDLTLSDFDFGVCHESDDFDDDFDEGLDNSFNPYEFLTYQPTQESWYSNIESIMSSPSSSIESSSLPVKCLTKGLDAEGQCQQFFDLLRNQCNAQSEQKQDNLQCCRENSDTFGEKTTDRTQRFTKTHNGGRIATRMVPKMGTKVEFTRPATSPSNGQIPSHLPWQLPLKLETRCSQQPTTQNRFGDLKGRSLDHNSDPLDLRPTQLHGGNSDFNPHVTGFYHSDSERSNLAACFSLRNRREWNSDGDSKNVSFPSSDDSAEQSPEPHDASRDDPKKMDSLRRLYEQYADVMYTNKANLQHTIMVQQRLFEQQIANRNRTDERNLCVKSTQPIHSFPRDPWAANPIEQSAPLEWVIKRRADGTRYITRRAIATKSKEPAKQQPKDDKRCVVMTTGEDAGSEPKTGRYWTKEERRQHVEKARGLRRIKERMAKLPVGVAKETSPPPDSIQSTTIQPVETKKSKVRKDHNRVRSQDHAVTFQELLAHGRVEARGKPSENPLLSVITI